MCQESWYERSLPNTPQTHSQVLWYEHHKETTTTNQVFVADDHKSWALESYGFVDERKTKHKEQKAPPHFFFFILLTEKKPFKISLKKKTNQNIHSWCEKAFRV